MRKDIFVLLMVHQFNGVMFMGNSRNSFSLVIVTINDRKSESDNLRSSILQSVDIPFGYDFDEATKAVEQHLRKLDFKALVVDYRIEMESSKRKLEEKREKQAVTEALHAVEFFEMEAALNDGEL